MPGTALAVAILGHKQLNSLSTETLLQVASRALYEASRRTGSDQEFVVRNMAYKAVQATLLCERGEVFPNDKVTKLLREVKTLANQTIKEVR
jgi:hypothetical protein